MPAGKTRHVTQLDSSQKSAGGKDFQGRTSGDSLVVNVDDPDDFVPNDSTAVLFETGTAGDVIGSQSTAWFGILITASRLEAGPKMGKCVRAPLSHREFNLHQSMVCGRRQR